MQRAFQACPAIALRATAERPETVLRTGSRAPSSHARKRRGNRCPCPARTSALSSMPEPSPRNPGGIPSVPSSKTRKAHFAFRPQEAATCRHVGHAARIAMPSALQAVRPVRRVVMSPLFLAEDPAPALDETPTACQVVCRFTKGHFRAAPQRSAEMSLLLRSGNPFRWIPGPSQSHHSAGETLAFRPPKGNGAVRSRMQSSQAAVAPACHCAVLVYRPHTVCADRAAGIVALFPFHAPAVPFVAASIPRHSAVASGGFAAVHARKTPCHLHQSF